MLVLSRREREKIVFPALRTSVEVLEVKAGRVRLGIEAPADVQILREEVLKQDAAHGHTKPATIGAEKFNEALVRKIRHDVRNQLNSASIGLALARRQLKAGMVDGVEGTLEKVVRGMQSLEGDVQRLVETAHSKPSDKPFEALLVEDDNNECELLAGFLRMAGIKVNTAHDGEEAVNRLRNGAQPDVMLLDMNMPRCDGVTTVRMIRNDPHLADLKIFAVTGYSADQLGVDTERDGLDGWFQKPLDPERLLGALRNPRRKCVPA